MLETIDRNSPITGEPYFPVTRDELESLAPVELLRHVDTAGKLGPLAVQLLAGIGKDIALDQAVAAREGSMNSLDEVAQWVRVYVGMEILQNNADSILENRLNEIDLNL